MLLENFLFVSQYSSIYVHTITLLQNLEKLFGKFIPEDPATLLKI